METVGMAQHGTGGHGIRQEDHIGQGQDRVDRGGGVARARHLPRLAAIDEVELAVVWVQGRVEGRPGCGRFRHPAESCANGNMSSSRDWSTRSS